MDKFKKQPLLVDVDDFFKSIKAYNCLKVEKFLDVELSASEITKLKIPNYLIKLSQDFNFPLEQLINCILRDFVIKFNYGEGKLKKSIWKNFQKIQNLSPEQKASIFKALFKE